MDRKVLIISEERKILDRPEPIPPKDRTFSEEFLQKLIFTNPELIPIEELEGNKSKLIPIEREVPVSSGLIDNLYLLSPDWTICIVETKLWRNPEAHRTVLAQIIGYARSLSTMSFDEFCQAVTKDKSEKAVASFFRKIKYHLSDFSEEEVQSKIQESLSSGRFLLLIVGDRIFPEVVLLKEVVSSAPNLEFNIQLIELHFFRLENNPKHFLVVPQLVSKTSENTRAVVKIRYEQKKPEIEVTAIEPSEQIKIGKTTQKEFLSSLPEGFASIISPYLEEWEKRGYTIYWGVTGFSVRIPVQGKLKTIFDIYPTSMSVLTEKRRKSGMLPEEICSKYRAMVRDIPAISRVIAENKVYVDYKYISTDEFKKLLVEMDKTLLELSKFYENSSE